MSTLKNRIHACRQNCHTPENAHTLVVVARRVARLRSARLAGVDDVVHYNGCASLAPSVAAASAIDASTPMRGLTRKALRSPETKLL